MSNSREQLEKWLKTIDVEVDNVLDIGGSQLSVKGRTKSWNVKDYKILDLEQPHECKQEPDIICDIQKRSIVSYDHTGLDCDEPGAGEIDSFEEREPYVLRYLGNEFNKVFCLEVSEYWIQPLNALKNINYLLKNGGELYISFHFIYPVHNPVEQDCLRYTEQGVRKLLKETGFEIIEIKPRLIKCIELWRNFYISEGMRPVKEYDKHSWQGCLIKAKKI